MSSSANEGSNDKVPYFVLQLGDGKAKALFTVPTNMAQALVTHPILCRGSAFDLEIDVVSQGRKKQRDAPTSFLSTEFTSPTPDETAQAISERIAIRLGNPDGPAALAQYIAMR